MRKELESLIAEHLFLQAKEAIVLVDGKGKIFFWNRGAELLFGYEKEEALGKLFYELIIPFEQKERVKRNLHDFSRTGQGRRVNKVIECNGISKNGEKLVLEVSVYPLRIDGQWYAYGIIRDISKRKEVEISLEILLRESKRLLEAVPSPAFIIDKNFKVLEANNLVLKVIGKKKAEVVGRKCYDVLCEKRKPLLDCPAFQILSMKKPQRLEKVVEVKRLNRTFKINVTPIVGRDGNVEKFIFIMTDITEAKKVEIALRSLYKIMVEIYNQKGLPEMMERVREALGKIMNTENFFVILYEKEDQLSFPYYIGEKQRQEVLEEEEKLIRNTLKSGVPVFLTLQDIKRKIRGGFVKETKLPPKVWIGVPLKMKGRIIGLMVLQSYKKENALTRSDVYILELISEEIALAVEMKKAEEERQKAQKKLRDALNKTIEAMAIAIEKRDPYTAGHQRRVAELSVAIAREMGLSEDRTEGIRFGAMIHDIGKIQVPLEILSKPGRLTEAEYEIIKTHPEAGYEIIREIEFPWPIDKIVLQHHERLDGSGYPLGLKDGEIILEARIVAVADVVEAMSSHRPYRPAVGIEKALEEIERYKGRHYDPEVVDACIRLFKEKGFRFSD